MKARMNNLKIEICKHSIVYKEPQFVFVEKSLDCVVTLQSHLD